MRSNQCTNAIVSLSNGNEFGWNYCNVTFPKPKQGRTANVSLISCSSIQSWLSHSGEILHSGCASLEGGFQKINK